MKINQIEAFIAIAEGKGVAGASEILCVTQPAVSMSIGNLEEELGEPLFDRSGSRLELNAFGAIFYRRAKAARAEMTLVEQEIALLKQRLKGSVKFNASTTVLPKLIPSAINRFKQSHADVHFELAESLAGSPASKIQALMDGMYDFVITVVDENQENLGLSYEKLLEEELIFVASHGHPALKEKNPSLADLRKYSWLFPSPNGKGLPYEKFRAAFRRAKSQLPTDLTLIANRQVNFSLLEEGMYIAAFPYHTACFERSLSDFNIINVDMERLHWPVHLITRENTILSSVVSGFIDEIKTLVSQSESTLQKSPIEPG